MPRVGIKIVLIRAKRAAQTKVPAAKESLSPSLLSLSLILVALLGELRKPFLSYPSDEQAFKRGKRNEYLNLRKKAKRVQ